MIDDLKISSKVNHSFNETGSDSPNACLNKTYFKNYPYQITYQYNSRGFRDDEWPNDLKNAIWCIGDSYTAGIGSPIENTWHRILRNKTQYNTISISMDGASNDWISRRAVQVLNFIQPKFLVILWSFINRRESIDISLPDEDRRIWAIERATDDDDLQNFVNNRNKVLSCLGNTSFADAAIPKFSVRRVVKTKPKFNTADMHWMGEVKQLDVARDSIHFDKISAEIFANTISSKLGFVV